MDTKDTFRELQHNAALIATMHRDDPQIFDRLERLNTLVKCYYLESSLEDIE